MKLFFITTLFGRTNNINPTISQLLKWSKQVMCHFFKLAWGTSVGIILNACFSDVYWYEISLIIFSFVYLGRSVFQQKFSKGVYKV